MVCGCWRQLPGFGRRSGSSKCNSPPCQRARMSDMDAVLMSAPVCAQERIQLSQAQLTALIKVRRTLLAHIGALLAEREQVGLRIRVCTSPCLLSREHVGMLARV